MKTPLALAIAAGKRFHYRDTSHSAVYELAHDYLHSVILLKR
ncbi:MAG: hypothetical protein ACRDDF_07555 [Aeromonas sp.]